MNLFLAVVEDLATFAVDSVRGFFLPSSRIERPERMFNAPHAYTVLPASTETGGNRSLQTYLPQINAPKVAIGDRVLTHKDLKKSTVMYTSSVATALRSEPGVYGDTVYTILPYGSMVMVLDVRDSWAYIAHNNTRGWAHVDDLEDRAAHVYPEFINGEVYDADHPTTLRLRALIQDEFGGGELSLALQPEEFVLYKL